MEKQIADHVLGAKFTDLDDEAIAATKHHILHTLVCSVAGSNAPGISALRAMTRACGDRGDSHVLVHGDRTSAMSAALVNASMAHAQDYDMNDDRTFYKSSVVVIPTALAIAEQVGPVTGKDFITAVCVGVDLGVRIALAVNPKPSHVLSHMIGGLAAVAAAARLLRLDREQFLDALGIAYSQIGSGGGSTFSPALTKRLLPGLAARSAVFGAFLGREGFSSERNVLSGPRGYFSRYHKVEGDPAEILSGLGKSWQVVNVGPKGYPCCRVLHAPIDAALDIVRTHDIHPDEIESVRVRGASGNVFIMGDAISEEGVERRRHPRGVVDAQFSVHWAVAAALVRRDVFIDCFTEEALGDPAINKLTDRVEVISVRAMERPEILLAPASVEVRTRSGASFFSRADYARGNPRNPVTYGDTQQALRRSNGFAARPLDEERIALALRTLENLEDAPDIREVTRALCA